MFHILDMYARKTAFRTFVSAGASFQKSGGGTRAIPPPGTPHPDATTYNAMASQLETAIDQVVHPPLRMVVYFLYL